MDLIKLCARLTVALTMIVLGPGHLIRPLIHFPLAILLVVSVAEYHFPVQNLDSFS